jgi:hypothetical protein
MEFPLEIVNGAASTEKMYYCIYVYLMVDRGGTTEGNICLYSTDKEMTPATKAIHAHELDFVASDEMLLPFLKASHRELGHCTLLAMLYVFSL